MLQLLKTFKCLLRCWNCTGRKYGGRAAELAIMGHPKGDNYGSGFLFYCFIVFVVLLLFHLLVYCYCELTRVA